MRNSLEIRKQPFKKIQEPAHPHSFRQFYCDRLYNQMIHTGLHSTVQEGGSFTTDFDLSIYYLL
jgi:hypothetical protein